MKAEILALRHQLAVLQNNAPRHLHFNRTDRLVGCVIAIVVGLAPLPADRSARHGHPLAQSFRLVLDEEIVAPPVKNQGGCRNS
jgi:hypothetical protein